MKPRLWKRALALFLVLASLSALTAFAEPGPTQPETASEPEQAEIAALPDAAEAGAEPDAAPEAPMKGKSDSEMTDQELIAKYQIPNDWSRAALIFALRHGLLPIDSDQQLRPTEKVSRGSLAYMIMQVARTEQAGDLSAFTDVSASDWSYPYLARAYALGAIKGTSATTMSPNGTVTREQVFVILARLFGLRTNDRTAIYKFSDWKSVSDWAALDVSAMIQAGYVKGTGSSLKPKGEITRKEAAQLFYNLLTGLGEEIPASVTGRYALHADTVPSGTVVKGDLLLCNETGKITLDRVKVTGRLIIQGIGAVRLNLNNCTVGTLVLCRDTNLFLNNCTVGTLVLCRNTNLFLNGGSCSKVICDSQYINIQSDVKNLEIWDSLVSVAAGTTVQRADLMTSKSGLCVRGTVKDVHTWANKAHLYGKDAGVVEKLTVHVPDVNLGMTVGQRIDDFLPGVSDITVTKLETTKATLSSPKATMSVKIENLPQPQKEYKVAWYCDSKLVWSEDRVLLKDGDVIGTEVDFSSWLNAVDPVDSVPIKFQITCGSEKRTFSYSADVSDNLAKAAKAVRTQNIQAKVLYDCNLYSSTGLTGKIGTLKSGTWVTYILYDNKNGNYYSAKVRLSNGTVGWVAHSNLQISSGKFYVTWDYSTAVKEYWVNHVKKATSSTGYLIWASLYTQRVNIFTGSAGNWKLVKSYPCSSGLNISNTPPEDKTIQNKVAKWYFTSDGYYVDHVTNLDARGRAFHSRPKSLKDGSVTDYAMGYPSSHGCMRMMDDGVQYIYNNCPIGTKVVLY